MLDTLTQVEYSRGELRVYRVLRRLCGDRREWIPSPIIAEHLHKELRDEPKPRNSQVSINSFLKHLKAKMEENHVGSRLGIYLERTAPAGRTPVSWRLVFRGKARDI